MARPHKPKTPYYRFNSSPEVIRLVVLMYARFPLSLLYEVMAADWGHLAVTALAQEVMEANIVGRENFSD